MPRPENRSIRLTPAALSAVGDFASVNAGVNLALDRYAVMARALVSTVPAEVRRTITQALWSSDFPDSASHLRGIVARALADADDLPGLELAREFVRSGAWTDAHDLAMVAEVERLRR